MNRRENAARDSPAAAPSVSTVHEPGGIFVDPAQGRGDGRIATASPPSRSPGPAASSQDRAQDVQQHHVQQRGHDGLGAVAGAADLGGEQADGGVQR
ncbi:hypothetical protein GCM10020218_102300 [Dactylosporangium vinaceum]